MRNRHTHFEQVPIEVVETVLQKAAAVESLHENSPAPVPAPQIPAVAESLKKEKTTPSRGQL
jgi:hypothetical protein